MHRLTVLLAMVLIAGCSSSSSIHNSKAAQNGGWHCQGDRDERDGWNCRILSEEEHTRQSAEQAEAQRVAREAARERRISIQQRKAVTAAKPVQLPTLSAQPVVSKAAPRPAAPTADASFAAQLPRDNLSPEPSATAGVAAPRSLNPQPELAVSVPIAASIAEEKPAGTYGALPDSGYVLQLGAFAEQVMAETAVNGMDLQGYPVWIEDVLTNGKYLFVVACGQFATAELAHQAAAELKARNPGLSYWVRSAKSLQEANRAAG